MTVAHRPIEGKKYWVIDLSLRRRSDGKLERYRRVAAIQNRHAARAEEQRLEEHFRVLDTFRGFGKPVTIEASTVVATSAPSTSKRQPSWEDAVEHWRAVVAPKVKASTRKGYEALLTAPHMRHWKGRKLQAITRGEIDKWDAMIVKSDVGPSTRRNHHVILRAILKSVGPIDGEPGVLIQTLPVFPKLPPVGRKSVDAASPEDVAALLDEGDGDSPWAAHRERARLAFGLAALAGLRAGEIRGLRSRDVDLRRCVITVRVARVVGEEGTPKSGHERQIPIAAKLLPLLRAACAGLKPDDYVSRTANGTPWSDTAIWAALRRASKRLGLSTRKVHALRHAFATQLFGASVDARTVQALLGHSSLEVTQRYAHTSAERARAAVATAFA